MPKAPIASASNGQRELRWFAPEEAARNVHEPELARILGNARLLEALR